MSHRRGRECKQLRTPADVHCAGTARINDKQALRDCVNETGIPLAILRAADIRCLADGEDCALSDVQRALKGMLRTVCCPEHQAGSTSCSSWADAGKSMLAHLTEEPCPGQAAAECVPGVSANSELHRQNAASRP